MPSKKRPAKPRRSPQTDRKAPQTETIARQGKKRAPQATPPRTWLLTGPAVGLMGGMIAGLVEPTVRMWSVRKLMTTWLWLEAFSFSLVTQGVLWCVACTSLCLLGLAATLPNRWLRRRLHPGPLACAVLLAGLAVMIVWGEPDIREVKLPRSIVDLRGALLVGLGIMVPVAAVSMLLRRTIVGRCAAGFVGLARWPALVLTVISLGIQWHARARIQSADGFWPRTTSRPAGSRTGRAPDVVFVVFDALRRDRLGCYGYHRPTSPHIDAFAADAVQFQKAIAPSVWTLPTHASMFTGLYRSQHGVGWDREWLDDRFVTMAEILRDHGYQTIALSNNAHVSPGTNLTQGFQRYHEPLRLSYTVRNCVYQFAKQVCVKEGPLGRVLGRWFPYDAGGRATAPLAADLLRRRDRSRPFLLFINYMESHWPYDPTRAYRKAFVQPDELSRSYGIEQSVASLFLYNMTRVPVYTDRDMQTLSDLYDARVREVDDHFADLMRVLAAEVDLDETLVILAADHGENLGDHRLLGHNLCIYNTLLHVPLIVRWPRALRQQRVDRIVETTDLFPTIVAWAGAEPTQSGKVMGRSLAEALRSTPQSDARSAFAEHLYPPVWAFRTVRDRVPTFDHRPWLVAFRAVLGQQWKLILRTDRRAELYDLSADPREQRNLLHANPAEAARLQKQIAEWSRSFKQFDPNKATGLGRHRLTDEQKRRLRDIGYVH